MLQNSYICRTNLLMIKLMLRTKKNLIKSMLMI